MARPKVKIRIKTRFTDEQGGQLFGPGEWDVDPAVSMRLIAAGRATLVNPPKGEAAAPQTKKEPTKPQTNPRIPPANTEEGGEAKETPLPEGFPNQATLAVAGFTTVESLQVPDVREKLAAVEGLTPADITKIGLAISKI
jgi:hypothetical protein